MNDPMTAALALAEYTDSPEFIDDAARQLEAEAENRARTRLELGEPAIDVVRDILRLRCAANYSDDDYAFVAGLRAGFALAALWDGALLERATALVFPDEYALNSGAVRLFYACGPPVVATAARVALSEVVFEAKLAECVARDAEEAILTGGSTEAIEGVVEPDPDPDGWHRWTAECAEEEFEAALCRLAGDHAVVAAYSSLTWFEFLEALDAIEGLAEIDPDPDGWSRWADGLDDGR